MMEIAIYGKGGIGKSTVSANLSATMAKGNRKVLQVGCDPKHDSTRLLLSGQTIVTALDYMKQNKPQDYVLDDIVHRGAFGISCVEAGGPEPGVGCAGRGILSTFQLLDDLGLDRSEFDVVLYDVLGDVVCGGFAVPLRQEYADAVYIVTSGEFMSIYAANNILRGLENYSQGGPRAGGLIFNSRGLEEEDERIEKFSKAVGLPVIVRIPRDDKFAISERKGKCLVEQFPDSEVAKLFSETADYIYNQSELYEAKPLSDEELEEVVLGVKSVAVEKREIKERPVSREIQKKYYSKSLLSKEPLHGCGYNGAVNLAVQISDGVIVSHGPRSCANLSYQSITSLGRRSLFEKSIVLPIQLSPNLVSTEMNENSMVFGGTDELRDTLKETIDKKPNAIVVVTTCPSGIIGDDVEQVIGELNTDIPIIFVPTDGNLTGDYMQGMIMAYEQIALQLVDRTCESDKKLVNFYGEKSIANATAINIEILSNWLEAFGARIHCRYLNNTTTEEIKTLKSAGLHINSHNDYMGRIIADFFKREFDIDFFPNVFPIGYDDSVELIRGLAKFYDMEDVGEKIIDAEKDKYYDSIESMKSELKGKKLMLVS